MSNKFKNFIHRLFRKEKNEVELYLPDEAQEKFVLKLENIEIGYLECREGIWSFYYSEAFKNKSDLYSIPGFPNLDKKYTSESLWPFFKIRIPGLGQPAIKEILSKENIDKRNELALLKRFGKRSIANPYTLILS
ncbi:MAG: HipA N-terminal domain-containing protein [Saprospiraceae bacterium]